jgi:hypothetical protein
MAMIRRRSARRGGLGNVVLLVDFVLERGRGVAGDGRGGRELRESSGSSIYCTKGQNEGVTRCARKWGRWLGPSGGADTVGGVKIDDRRWRHLRIPTRNLVGLGRFSRVRRKGSKGGVLGPFIGGLAWEGG